MSARKDRKWFIMRDPRHVATSKGDDWMIAWKKPDGRSGYACWYGNRSDALKDLRRRFNGHAGKIL
jgi:hypothetical protein